MTKGIIISIVSVFVVIGVFLAVSSPAITSESTQSSVQAVSTKQTIETIKNDVSNGSMLLDVRTTEEYTAGHVAQATLLPLADIEAGIMPQADKTKPLYVYCRSGNRSAQATQLLEASGFTNVVDLGGLEDVAVIGAQLVR